MTWADFLDAHFTAIGVFTVFFFLFILPVLLGIGKRK